MQIWCLQRTLGSLKDPRERILKLKIHCTKSKTHLESHELSIMKDDKLVPEQRKKTGQLGHHRSTAHPKGMQIHDRAHGKESEWTNISFNRQNDTNFQEPISVHLGDSQKLKTAEQSPAEKEPTANFVPDVLSLKFAQVLDQWNQFLHC
ncbi:uncharacterized protein [Malus domestica]|uniref:uncharacterized protein isoform X1 n=1 Tax=Malus domestica TaxID=3750 RepID=UPI0010A9DEC0|nr:uncharacterized protein LOC103428707 isoform X1 [Malus domestica]